MANHTRSEKLTRIYRIMRHVVGELARDDEPETHQMAIAQGELAQKLADLRDAVYRGELGEGERP